MSTSIAKEEELGSISQLTWVTRLETSLGTGLVKERDQRGIPQVGSEETKKELEPTEKGSNRRVTIMVTMIRTTSIVHKLIKIH